MPVSRRTFLTRAAAACAAALLPASIGSALAETYPSHPVTLVIPFAAGSTSDLVGRILAERLGKALGQNVVTDNRGGAGGTLAAEAVARAAPDGYTLLLGTIATHGISPAIYPKINYDPVGDFAPIAQFGSAPNVIVVPASLPVNSLRQLIDYIRARPGAVNYASSGNGSSAHLSGAMFASRNELQVTHVPYRGGSQALTDLLRGEVQFMFYQVLPVLGHINEGKLRALAITSTKRSPVLPDVPTMQEAGMDDFDVSAWFGVYAPARTPPELIAKLNAQIVSIAASAEVQKTLLDQGMEPVSGRPEELLALTRSEIARWALAVKLSDARLQ
jgi:tripartite-type tricarboxylate transporter receptor subunit TctC